MSPQLTKIAGELAAANSEKTHEDLIYHLDKSLFLGLRERQFLTARLIYDQLTSGHSN
jgi:hypothetical protein